MPQLSGNKQDLLSPIQFFQTEPHRTLSGGGFVGLPHSSVKKFKDILGIFDFTESKYWGWGLGWRAPEKVFLLEDL